MHPDRGGKAGTMGLRETVSGWWRHDAAKYHVEEIPRERVLGRAYDPSPVVAGRDYFRLWLAEMYLGRDRDWGVAWQPAVHALVRFEFGSQTVEVPHVSGKLALDGVDSHLDRVVQLNHPLTGLRPFNGGVVELHAGLVALRGGDPLKRFLGAMGNFATLLAQPQLSTVLPVLGPVADGMNQLIEAGAGGLHIGLHQSFTAPGGDGGNPMRPGYVAVLRAEKAQLLGGDRKLWVEGDRLSAGPDEDRREPLKGVDYLLFSIERRQTRDDWERLSSIREPFEKAVDALAGGFRDTAEAYRAEALTAATLSPELTRADRRRVTDAIKADYTEAADLGSGATDVEEMTFARAMATAGSVEAAFAAGEPTVEEALSSGSGLGTW